MRAGAMWLCCLCALALEASAGWRGRKDRGHHHDKWLPKWMRDFGERDASGMPKWQRKLCKKMGHLAGVVPGLDECKHAYSDRDHKRHPSKRDLENMLKAEQERAKRLHDDLDKEKADKRQKVGSLEQQVQGEKHLQKQAMHLKTQLGAKDRELLKEKAARQQMEHEHRNLKKQVREENGQKKHLKSKLEISARELQKEKDESVQAFLLKRRLESRIHDLEKDLPSLRSSLEAKSFELEKEKADNQFKDQMLKSFRVDAKPDRVSELETEVANARARAGRASKHLEAAQAKLVRLEQLDLESLLQNVSDLTSQIMLEKNKTAAAMLALEDESEALDAERTTGLELQEALDAERTKLKKEECSSEKPCSLGLTIFAAVIAVGLANASFKMRHQLYMKSSELAAKCEQLSSLEAEFNCLEAEFKSEVGGMMKMDRPAQNLGTDFTFHISEQVDQETVRSVKIQCPGVRHSDVDIEIIFNGCIVKINRQPSQGVGAEQWEHRFQFRPSEGLFEFKEDQATLECGFLTLFFRAFTFQSRTFRFPKHFDLSETDVDGTWEYPQDSAAGDGTEPSVLGTAPGRLETTAAATPEFEDVAQALRENETSGSPVSTDDYEAARAHIAGERAAPGEADVENVVPATALASSLADYASNVLMQEVLPTSEDLGSPEITGDLADQAHLPQGIPCSQEGSSSEGTSEDYEKLRGEEDYEGTSEDYEGTSEEDPFPEDLSPEESAC